MAARSAPLLDGEARPACAPVLNADTEFNEPHRPDLGLANYLPCAGTQSTPTGGDCPASTDGGHGFTSGVNRVSSILPSNFDDLAASELSIPEPGCARAPADGPGVESGTPPIHPIFSTDFADPPTLGSAFIGPFVVDEPVDSLLAQALAQLHHIHSGSSNIGGQAPRATCCPFVHRCRPFCNGVSCHGWHHSTPAPPSSASGPSSPSWALTPQP